MSPVKQAQTPNGTPKTNESQTTVYEQQDLLLKAKVDTHDTVPLPSAGLGLEDPQRHDEHNAAIHQETSAPSTHAPEVGVEHQSEKTEGDEKGSTSPSEAIQNHAMPACASDEHEKTMVVSRPKKRTRSIELGKKILPNTAQVGANAPDETWHPLSRYKEPPPQLSEYPVTLYDQFRYPLRPESGRPWYSFSALQQEVRCGICLDLIQNARIVRECLHHFCDSCIEKALNVSRKDKKECPICRVAIPSKRSLATDNNFNRLLESITRDFDPSQELASSSMLQDAINRKKDAMANNRQRAHDNEGEDCVGNIREPTVSVKVFLIRKGEAELLKHPYIKISGDASLGIIRTFLQEKLAVPSILLLTSSNDQREILPDQIKLWDLRERMKSSLTPNGYLPIFYH